MNIFGNINCPHCFLETRFLFESEKDENAFYMLGDMWEENSGYFGDVECDYCQKVIKLHVVTKEQTISAFLNGSEYEAYLYGRKEVKKAKENQGLESEKSKNLTQFHETFTSDFKKHPYHKGKVIRIGSKKWKVESVYKKEDVEKDAVKRLFAGVYDEYCYKLSDENKEIRWLSVVDLKQNNAILTPEAPSLRQSEKLIDVTDTLFKTTKIYEQEISKNYKVEGYEYISGIRLLVYNKENEIEMDVFDDDIESSLKQVEHVFSIEEE